MVKSREVKIMGNKKTIKLLVSVLGMFVINFGLIGTSYGMSKVTQLFKEKVDSNVYDNYIRCLTDIAEKTGLVDFSLIDIGKINIKEFEVIYNNIKKVLGGKKDTKKLTILINSKEYTTRSGTDDGNNFAKLARLTSDKRKEFKNRVKIQNVQTLGLDKISYGESVVKHLKAEYRSSLKSGVLNLVGLPYELPEVATNIIKACIARLRFHMGEDKKLALVYDESIEKKIDGCIKVAEKLGYDICKAKSKKYVESIEQRINMAYEEDIINLINLCGDPDSIGDGEQRVLFGCIKEFAERYNFDEDKKKVKVLVGWQFRKCYSNIEELCGKYNGRFEIIKEEKFLKSKNDKYLLDYTNTDAVDAYTKNIFTEERLKNYYVRELTGSILSREFMRVFDVSKPKNFDRSLGTDKSAGIISDYKQDLTKKLNTAYKTNWFVIDADLKVFSPISKMSGDTVIATANKIVQRKLRGKKVNDLTVFANFESSPKYLKMKEILEKMKVKVEGYDTKIYQYVKTLVENAEITGVLDLSDAKKLDEIEDSENFEMMAACVTLFLKDNETLPIKMRIGNKTNPKIKQKLSKLKTAFRKLTIIEV